MKVDQRCQAQTTSRLFGEDVGDIVEVVTYKVNKKEKVNKKVNKKLNKNSVRYQKIV